MTAKGRNILIACSASSSSFIKEIINSEPLLVNEILTISEKISKCNFKNVVWGENYHINSFKSKYY